MLKKFRIYVLFSAAIALVGLLINRYRQEQTPQTSKVEILVTPQPTIQTTSGPAAPPAKAAAPKKPDDLTQISGIGPKISAVLQTAGITTFEQLAGMSPESIRQILDEAGIRLGKPDTWPEQARLAASDK